MFLTFKNDSPRAIFWQLSQWSPSEHWNPPVERSLAPLPARNFPNSTIPVLSNTFTDFWEKYKQKSGSKGERLPPWPGRTPRLRAFCGWPFSVCSCFTHHEKQLLNLFFSKINNCKCQFVWCWECLRRTSRLRTDRWCKTVGQGMSTRGRPRPPYFCLFKTDN